MSTTSKGASAGSATVALWVLATIVTLFFLRAASQLLIPIVLAVLISYVLEPVVSWLARHHVHRIAGTTLVLAVTVGLMGWGAYSLRDELSGAIKSLPEAARRAREMVTSNSDSGVAASFKQAASELRGDSSSGGTGQEAPSRGAEQKAEPKSGSEGEAAKAGGQPSASSGNMGGLTSLIQSGATAIFTFGGNVAVIFFLVFFILISGTHVKARIIEVSGPDADSRRTAAKIIDDIDQQIQRFLLVRLITAVVVALATWLVLLWMGVENAAVWGTLAGVFNSIPYFGPIIVSGGLFIVGLVQGGGMSQALQMSGAALLITSLEGYLLSPPLMGKAERMGALAIFLGLLLWTWIWGAWGTILAVPMLVIVKSVADHIPRLKPIGRLMAP